MFQQPIKNFSINFNALNERNTISSGDLLTGHISFDLTKPTRITSVTMTLKGQANVHWSTGSRNNRRHISAKVEYFNLKGVILQENRAVAEPEKLQSGTHVYPFTCQLPQGDFPSTFKAATGKILYTMTVEINRPWHLSKDFVTELNFVNRVNTNQPGLLAPLSGSNTTTLCCLWCASGAITVTATIEKKAFTPGETVKIICEFSNGSSRTATPNVSLQQKQVFYSHNRVSKRMHTKKLVSLSGHPVRPYTSDVHTEIMLTIPPLASHTISNCSIIEVEYFIEMSLSITGFPDLTVLFPIILCDAPVNAQPALYS